MRTSKNAVYPTHKLENAPDGSNKMTMATHDDPSIRGSCDKPDGQNTYDDINTTDTGVSGEITIRYGYKIFYLFFCEIQYMDFRITSLHLTFSDLASQSQGHANYDSF